MIVELNKINVEALVPGMFVSKLDRPWLETPFQLQGFFIRDNSDIDVLKTYCSYVYIDVEKTPPPDTKKTSYGKVLPKTLKNDITNIIKTHSIKHSTDKVSFLKELPTAKKEFTLSLSIVRQVMIDMKKSGKLNVSDLKNSVKPLVDSVLRNRNAMACLCMMKEKDSYLYRHSISTSIWALLLGRHLGFNGAQLNSLAFGAILLDIGKTKVPESILNKTKELTKEEEHLMQQHVQHGLDILAESGVIDEQARVMVASHHERFDGKGYPQGLAGEDIPIFGRIAAIVDCFDAMTSPRAYAKQLSTYETLRQFHSYTGKLFQKELVEQFIQAIGFFPTGTLVELSNQSVGIVVSQNKSFRLKPDIMIILNEDKKLNDDFSIISLEDKRSLWIKKGLEPGSHGIDPNDFFLDT